MQRMRLTKDIDRDSLVSFHAERQKFSLRAVGLAPKKVDF